jgi:hypothetical protein
LFVFTVRVSAKKLAILVAPRPLLTHISLSPLPDKPSHVLFCCSPLSGDAEKADNQATLAKLAPLSQDGCDQAAAGSEALSDLALFDAWKVALGTCTTTLASHLDTPLGSQPMSLGAASSREFRSISPDCMSRSSSAWDGTGPPTNCGAPTISMTAIHAAAASAQMLPLEVQALIRQQQAASLAGSLPRAAPGELQQRAAPSPFESGAGSFKSQPSLKGPSQPYSGQPMPVQPASGWAPPPAAACSTTAQLPAPSASQRPEGALLLLKSLLHRHQQNQQQQLYEQQQLLQQKQAQLAQLLHPALLGQPAVNNTCSVQFPLSQQYQQYVPQVRHSKRLLTRILLMPCAMTAHLLQHAVPAPATTNDSHLADLHPLLARSPCS